MSVTSAFTGLLYEWFLLFACIAMAAVPVALNIEGDRSKLADMDRKVISLSLIGESRLGGHD